MYRIQKESRSEFVPIRQLRYHVRQWGTPAKDTPPLVMVHGWMDVSASFQFLVDAFSREWRVVAPDWRGFGGSQLSDSVAFVDRIVTPYKPKLVLLYAGDNDIASGKSPERVFADFKTFVSKIHAALPDTRIAYIAIKPCPLREKFLDQVKTANRLIQEYTTSDKRLLFVDVFTPMLTKAGRPRADLCIKDGLHPNAQCYELWAALLRPILDQCDSPRSNGKQP